MISDKLKLYAKKEDADRIFELVSRCVPETDINPVFLTAYTPDCHEEKTLSSDCRCVVLPEGFKVQGAEGVRVLTYSMDSTKGDISALNIQNRTNCTCFEVLYGVFMSRVFIPKESVYTPMQVFITICILCGFGASIDKLIPQINELLK